MNASDKDTIVAIATASGEGAIGIIRLSGPNAISISDQFFHGRTSLQHSLSHTLSYGQFRDRGQDLDQILASVMRAPNSFTGEDTVELNCHGGPFLLRKLIGCLIHAGARPASPGEFTKRAFLNGKLDLSQAEAVADMITATSDLGLQSAFFQLRGGLLTRFEAIAESLRSTAMLLEAGLDFSEDVDIDPQAITPPLVESLNTIESLIASYERGKIIREGVVVTLAGQPNVGKSSLLNRLLEEDRAIVTDIPGTTRDTIEEQIDLDGLTITLVDTAGIRDTLDPVELEGTRRSQQSINKAALVLHIVDGSLPPPDTFESLSLDNAFLVLNKCDLNTHHDWDRFSTSNPTLEISAKTGHGIQQLRSNIRQHLLGTADLPTEIITRERHVLALQFALDGLNRALSSLNAASPGEIIALDLRLALDALSEIIGQTTPDDVLDRIFQSFCIGK